MTAPAGDPDVRRGRATLRRAAVTGGVTGIALAVAGVAIAVRVGTGGGAAGVLALFGVVAGLLVASAWLLASIIVDLLAGRRPSRRLLVATAAVVVATFVAPILVVGASGVPPGG